MPLISSEKIFVSHDETILQQVSHSLFLMAACVKRLCGSKAYSTYFHPLPLHLLPYIIEKYCEL